MKMIKVIFGAFVLTVICLSFSIALGETINKTVPFPQDIDEKKVMEVAMSECMKMKYDLQKEKGENIFKKIYTSQTDNKDSIYLIKLSVAPGENGQKVLSLDGEFIGHPVYSSFFGPNLNRDVGQVENAVKKYLESK
jgi:hypothetical protein